MPDEFRERCRAIIRSLAIPRPFALEGFRQALERSRGRQVLFQPTETGSDCSGLWFSTADTDYVCYERDTTLLHQVHIIGHESGHMLLDHQGTLADDIHLTGRLFPDLGPALVRSMLSRSGYSCTEEHQAEIFASVLTGQVAADLRLPGREAEDLRRVEAAFGRVAVGRA